MMSTSFYHRNHKKATITGGDIILADKIRPLIVQIGGDTGPLTKAFDGAKKDAAKLQGELREVNRALKFDPSNTTLLAQKQKILAESITATTQKLEALKSAEKQMAGNVHSKEEAEQYRALQREIEATKGKLENLTKEYGQLGNSASQTLDRISEKTTAAGKAIMPLSAAVAGIGTAAVASFAEVDAGMDKVITATGATGDKAQALEDVFDNVASSIAADFEQIGGAIGEVNTRFGFMGGELEGCSEDFLKFARVSGTDATQSVRLVSRAMGDAGIEAGEYKKVLDMLTKAAQDSGISIDTLTGNLAKYGAPMRQLGFDTNETIALFSGWEKAGVNVEIAFSGMKQAIGNWSKAGKDASKEFQKMLNKIKNAPTLAKASAKAIEVFGQKAGPDLADAIRGGRFEFEDLLKSIESSQGILDATFNQISDGLDDAKTAVQSGKLALAALGKEILKSFAPTLKSAAKGFKDFTDWFKELDDGTKRFITTTGILIAAVGPLLMITGSVSHGISALITLYTTLTARKIAETTATVAATAAQGGLNAAMAASPAGMVALGIGALVAAIAAIAVNAKQAQTPLDNLNKQLDEQKKKMEDLKKTRNESIESGVGEISHLQSMVTELKTLVTANGQIIRDKERVKFLTQEINKLAPGTIEWTDKERISIEGGVKALDLMIAKKKAQIVLDAMEPEYKEAIMNINDKVMQQAELSLQLEEQKKKARDLEAQYNENQGPKTLKVLNLTRQNIQDLQYSYDNVTASIDEAYQTMDKWEGLSEAVASDSIVKINEKVSGVTNSFKSVKSMTEKELREQSALAARMVEENSKNIERLGSDAARNVQNSLTNEYNGIKKQLYSHGKTSGKNVSQGMADGMLDGIKIVQDAARQVANAATTASKQALDEHSPSRVFRDDVGKNVVLGFAAGIQDNMHMAVKSMAEGMKAVIDATEINRPALPNPTYISNISNVSSTSSTAPVAITERYYMTIDAKSVREFSDLVRMAQEARQMRRAYGYRGG